MADETVSKFIDLAKESSGGSGLAASLRDAAVAALTEKGFPTPKTDGWRKTPLKDVLAVDYAPAASNGKHTDRAWWRNGLAECRMLTMANGRWNKGCSNLEDLPDGLEIVELSESGVTSEFGSLVDVKANPFAAINTAGFADALVVRVCKGTVIEQPLHIFHQTHSDGSAVLANQRVLVVAEANSSVTIIESFSGASESKYLTTAVSEFVVGENAQVNHIRLQDESANGYHMGSTWANVGRSGRFTSHALSFGGKLARHDIHSDLVGEGAECTFNGLYLGDGDQLLDTHSIINHVVPYCNSHQLYRGIVDETATGVFNGLINVHKHAQKTDARQHSSAILLSETAHVFAEPQLEIYADDVQCAHGSTIGQLDEEQLFYLQTRGIEKETAKSLLLVAFAAESFSKLPVKELFDSVDNMLMESYSGA